MQKRLAVVLLASALSSPAVLADDTNWDGFYIGVGGHSASFDLQVDPDPGVVVGIEEKFFAFTGSGSTKSGEFIIGYKHDLGLALVGLELRPTLGGGMTIASVKQGDLIPSLPGFITIVSTNSVTTKMKGSLVATVEFPMGDRLLVGGEAGFAQAKAEMFGRVDGPEDFFTGVREDWMSYNGSASKTAFIWGARASFAITDSFSLTARYSKANFGTLSVPAKLGSDLVPEGRTLSPVEASIKSNMFSLGVTYRF